MKKNIIISILILVIINLLLCSTNIVEASTAEITAVSDGDLSDRKDVKVTLVLSDFVDADEKFNVTYTTCNYPEEHFSEYLGAYGHFCTNKEHNQQTYDYFTLNKKEITIGAVNYDDSVFENIEASNFVPANGWNINSNGGSGYIITNPSGNFGTGTIATLNLQVKDDFVGDSSAITFESINSRNYYGAINEKSQEYIDAYFKDDTMLAGDVYQVGNRSVSVHIPSSPVEEVEPPTTQKVESKKITPSSATNNLPYTGQIATVMEIVIVVVIVVIGFILLKINKIDKDIDNEK